MKNCVIIAVFLTLAAPSKGQVTYVSHIETIRYTDTVRVYWVAQSLFNQILHINKKIVFVNTHTDNFSNTEVNIDLIKESKGKKQTIKKFICPTGDNIESSLICDNINLGLGDVLYFKMVLNSKDKLDEFVFNIYNKQDAYRTLISEKLEQKQERRQPLLYTQPKVNPFLSPKPKPQKQISDRRKKVNRWVYNLLTIYQ